MPHAQRLRPGYSVVELLIVLVVVGVILGAAGVRFSEIVGTLRLSTASRVVATDLRSYVALAARQQRPVRIECVCGSRILRVVDLRSGGTLMQRDMSAGSDVSVGDLTLSASDRTAAITVYPNGLTSARLNVTISDGTRSRSVMLSSGGAVRMIE